VTLFGHPLKIFFSDMSSRYLAITGGVGGAKLSLGLSKLLGAESLALVVNTGDDFTHFDLHISPDIDTLVYTLSGESNTELGWGRSDESWQFMAAVEKLGGETWFRLGDKDLAMHIERSRLLRLGKTLGQTTSQLASSLGIAHQILPMSDDPVRTKVQTTQGLMEFQHYFVREQCRPEVTGFEFEGVDSASINPELVEWLTADDLAGVIICPSNPFVSIDPILSVPGLRQMLRECPVPVIAVSPIVGGEAIKGPTAKMMKELNVPNTASWVAQHYADFLDGFVLDDADQELVGEIESLKLEVRVTNTVMVSLDDRVQLAQDCLEMIKKIS
jgi:LPPG:FO 2-phospho-L-lactate transferase